jgi:hypothetical protein
MAARRIYPGKHQTLKLVGPLECWDCVLLGVHNETQPLHQHQTDRAACTKAARIDNLSTPTTHFILIRSDLFIFPEQIK